MKKFYLFIIQIFILSQFFYSCDKNETENFDISNFGYDYYPVAIGKSWTYKMDSFIYSLRSTVEIDSNTSYIREEIVDTLRNSQQHLIYRIDVFYSLDSLLGWELISSSFIEANKFQLNKIENGLTFIRLIFPVQKNKSWNGNSLISPKTTINVKGEVLQAYDNWYYSYQYLNRTDRIGSISFNGVCSVLEADEENIISKRYSESKYAKNIGMIYRELWILDTQNTNNSIAFQERAEKGFILKQSLISYR